jgi:uncharacterized repeat protein (TIGR01451 family)
VVRSAAVRCSRCVLVAAFFAAAGVAEGQVPILNVVKIGVPAAISAGDTAVFSIFVSNTGSGQAIGMTITDALPAGLAWSEDSTACAITSGTLSCSFPAFPGGASVQIVVTAPTSFSQCGVYGSTAVVSAANHAPVQSGSAIVVSCPDVRLSIEADEPLVASGERSGFTIVARNAGAGIARDVEVLELLPVGFGTVFILPQQNGCFNAEDGENDYVCDFGDLAPGAARTMHVVYTVDTAACVTVQSSASATGSNFPAVPAVLDSFVIEKAGDANSDCAASVLDVFRLINFLFAGGAPPA